MRQTSNYGLNQWEMTDLIKMEDFNSDNAKVDTALAGLAGQVASKASSSTVSSLSTKVNTKAAQSDLTAAVNRVTALESGKADKTTLTAEQTAREAADTALAAKAGAQFIRTVTMTQAANYFSIPLGDINWGDWREMHFVFQGAPSSGRCSVSFNGSSALFVDSYVAPCWHLVIFPCFTPALPVGGFITPFSRAYGTFCSSEA